MSWDYECSQGATNCPPAALVVTAGCSYELEVQVTSQRSRSSNSTDRAGSGGNKAGVVFSKKPHKPKPASWYLIAGLSEAGAGSAAGDAGAAAALSNVYYTQLVRRRVAETRGELLALKQTSLSTSAAGAATTASVRFEVPLPDSAVSNVSSSCGMKHISVVLSCDAILGVDVAVQIPVTMQL